MRSFFGVFVVGGWVCRDVCEFFLKSPVLIIIEVYPFHINLALSLFITNVMP